MSTEAEFKQHFVTVMRDLQKGSKDNAAMAETGTLAAGLVTRVGQTSWSGAKANMSPEQYREILTSFEGRGKRLADDGQPRKAYAIQLLTASLLARAHRKDPDIVSGEKLLDDLVDRTVAHVFRTVPRP